MVTVVVEPEKINDNLIVLDNLADINHIKNVFRKSVGEQIRAVDGKYEYICKIEKIDNKEVILSIIERNEDKFSSKTQIDAGISLLKNDKMDLTIQKLTEIGIKKIVPIAAKRSVVKLEKKKDKWDIIVRESLKQCQAVSPTEILDISSLVKIDYSFYDLIIIPYEAEEEVYLKDLFKNLDKKPQRILYIIGPEGGFDKEEIEFLRAQNAKIISLGKRILRAETAAIVTGGILINEFQ